MSLANSDLYIALCEVVAAGGVLCGTNLFLRITQLPCDALVYLLQRPFVGRVAIFFRRRIGTARELGVTSVPCAQLDVLERGHYNYLRGAPGALYGHVEVGGLPLDRRHTAALTGNLEARTRTSMAQVVRRIGIPCVCPTLLLCLFS